MGAAAPLPPAQQKLSPVAPTQGGAAARNAGLVSCVAASSELAALLEACGDCRRHLRACGGLPVLAQLLGAIVNGPHPDQVRALHTKKLLEGTRAYTARSWP